MKIRTDFVTNSSSVSYIVSMSVDIVKTFSKVFDYKRTPVFDHIVERIKDDLVAEGSHVYVEGEELYMKKYKFSTDETVTENIMDNKLEELKLDEMSTEDVWAFIHGEFIMNGRLAKTHGFGVTQVETY